MQVVGDPEIEGEARRYLAAAACLRVALRTLRPCLRPLDLLRCEALHALDAPSRARLLATKYRYFAIVNFFLVYWLLRSQLNIV